VVSRSWDGCCFRAFLEEDRYDKNIINFYYCLSHATLHCSGFLFYSNLLNNNYIYFQAKVSSPTSSGGPSTNPFLSSPTAAATATNTTQPIVDLFGSLPATADAPQVGVTFILFKITYLTLASHRTGVGIILGDLVGLI
jgi:hypothetical protein